MRTMMRRALALWLVGIAPAVAQMPCNPAGSPPNSIGCQPTLPGVMQSTDLFLGWRPSEGKAASRRVSPSQLLEATLPAAFSTLSTSSTATLGALVVSGNTTLNHPVSVTDTSSFFRFGYGAVLPLVKMQSAGTDAAGAAQQVLSISQQVTHTGTGGAGAVGALYSASTIDGAPNQDYYAAAFTMTNRAKRDSSATPDQAQHGTLFTHQIKDLPSGGLGPGEVMSDSWVQWWVMQDRTNLPSSQGGALVGVEFDISGNNADDAPTKKRFVRQAVLNNYAGDAAHPLEWGYGDYWNSFTGGTADTFFNVVSAYYAGWTVAAIDLSQGTGARSNPYIDGVNRGVAIKMRDGAKLGFNGDGNTGQYFTHGSSALQYWSGGAQQASISDAGLITTVGNLSLTTQSAGIYIGGNPVFRTPAQSLYTATLVGTNAGLNVDPAAIELTAVGHYAGGSGGNTPDGKGGGTGMTGPQNTMIGWFAGTQLVAGQFNTAVGNNSLGHEVSGSNNVAIGTDAMRNSRNNSSNIGIGVNALREADSTAFSIAIGTLALNGQTSSSGSSNIAIGYNAMSNTGRTTAANNVVVGGDIGTAVTSGSTNAFFGYRAGKSFTTGGNNTAVGGLAGTLLDTGAGHTIIGQNAGSKLTGGTNNVIIGQSVASTTLATGSNNIIIGTGSTADTATASTSSTFWVGGGSTAVMSATNIAGTPAVAIPGSLALGAGTLTVSAGSVGLSKITASAAAAGAGGGKIELVCGTNAGTAKLIAYAGTSATPVTILDNIGSGVTGC